MLYSKEKIYQDTVEIAKAAFSSASANNHLINANVHTQMNWVEDFIKNVYKALSDINNNPMNP